MSTTSTASSASTTTATTAVDIPAGANPRGTVIVIAGRGETAAVYTRFATRIAFDAYPVRVVTGAATDPDATAAAVGAVLADDELPAPRILIGSDAGAVLALTIAAGRGPHAPAGTVVAGLPGLASDRTDQPAALSADAELRSACPVHRAVLAQPENLTPDALQEPLPEALSLPDPAAVAGPVLAFLGEADPVIDVEATEEWLRAIPGAEVVRTAEGLHDALNDRTHRSVAARTVLFLEDVKNGGEPLLR